MVETSFSLDLLQGLSKSAMPNELFLIKNVILGQSSSINETCRGCTISIKIIYILLVTCIGIVSVATTSSLCQLPIAGVTCLFVDRE